MDDRYEITQTSYIYTVLWVHATITIDIKRSDSVATYHLCLFMYPLGKKF